MDKDAKLSDQLADITAANAASKVTKFTLGLCTLFREFPSKELQMLKSGTPKAFLS